MPKNRSSGFTLIELLVVILIIGVLSGLIVTAVGTVRQRALRAKAKTNIESFKTALSAYNSATGVYPQRGAQPIDDPECLFKALFTGNPKLGGGRDNYLEDWPVEQLGIWSGPNADVNAMWAQPSDTQLMFQNGQYTPIAFLDPWGRPYHYVQWFSFPEQQQIFQQLRAKGGAAYAIWSDGPDRTNDWGQNDDISSWSEGTNQSGTSTKK
jgi:prepilin-type N-terminal cleavage/methylation domain-containing protein